MEVMAKFGATEQGVVILATISSTACFASEEKTKSKK
jgi:hypothetical protein